MGVFERGGGGAPCGRPHARLKAGTPREAPTPAPTTKTHVPTTVNRRSTRAEATRRAPTFKFMARRVVWAALGAPRQHRDSTSHPSSEVGAGTYHWLRFNAQPLAGQWDSMIAQVRRVHSVKKRKPHSDSNSCLLPRGTTRPKEPATLPSAVQAVGVPAVVCALVFPAFL